MYIIVAGCGRVGAQLADVLSYEGHDVVIIDRDRKSFRRLGGSFNGVTLEGIAFDEELLLKAGIEEADSFAAVTNFDNTNLMAAEIASSIYDVPGVISRLYSPEKELTFYKLGIDYICSTTLMANRIRERIFQNESVTVQQERLDVGMQLVEFTVGSEAIGQPAGNLDYGVSSRLIMLLRGNTEIDWNGMTPLQAGDRVMVVLRKEGWSVVKECLGEEAVDSGACPADIIPGSMDSDFVQGDEPEKAKVIVGGCSQVGAYIAYILSMEGHGVTVIDENPGLFKRLSPNYEGDVLEGTVYDEETLIKAGIEEADAFTAVTKFDNTNLMASEVAKHIFHVPHIMARLFNPDKETTYQALDLNYVCGTRMLARALIERMLKPLVRTQTSCFNNMYDLVEFECPPAWDGETVQFAREKAKIKIAHIVRRSTGYMPDDKFVLRTGDAISALATTKRTQKLERHLRRSLKG